MQSRYSVTGGLMSARKTILLPILRILPERTPLISSSLLCGHRCLGVKRVLAAVTSCNAGVLFSLWDVNAVCNPLRHILPTQAQLMHPICPLWAPIHQAKSEAPKRRDNLLLKCLKGEGIVGALWRFFLPCFQTLCCGGGHSAAMKHI